MIKLYKLDNKENRIDFVVLENGIGTVGHDWGDGPIYAQSDFEYVDENEEIKTWMKEGYVEES